MRECSSRSYNLMGDEADALCGAVTAARASALISETGNGNDNSIHEGSLDLDDSQAAAGFLLHGLAAGTTRTGRTGTDQRGGQMLFARGIDAADGKNSSRLWASPACPSPKSAMMDKELDDDVEALRTRHMDDGTYTFVDADALVLKVREQGRVVECARTDRERGERRGLTGDPRALMSATTRTGRAGWPSGGR